MIFPLLFSFVKTAGLIRYLRETFLDEVPLFCMRSVPAATVLRLFWVECPGAATSRPSVPGGLMLVGPFPFVFFSLLLDAKKEGNLFLSTGKWSCRGASLYRLWVRDVKLKIPLFQGILPVVPVLAIPRVSLFLTNHCPLQSFFFMSPLGVSRFWAVTLSGAPSFCSTPLFCPKTDQGPTPFFFSYSP